VQTDFAFFIRARRGLVVDDLVILQNRLIETARPDSSGVPDIILLSDRLE